VLCSLGTTPLSDNRCHMRAVFMSSLHLSYLSIIHMRVFNGHIACVSISTPSLCMATVSSLILVTAYVSVQLMCHTKPRISCFLLTYGVTSATSLHLNLAARSTFTSHRSPFLTYHFVCLHYYNLSHTIAHFQHCHKSKLPRPTVCDHPSSFHISAFICSHYCNTL
jgi:hypothetical protein